MNTTLRPRLKRMMIPALALVAAFAAGYILRGSSNHLSPATPSLTPAPAAKAEVWTCSMHPQIRLPKFGLCPICNMDLIPAGADADSGGPRELKLSEHARTLAQIEVVPVESKFVEGEVRLVGKIQTDETRLVSATARVGGRLDRLYVDYTGARVTQDERLAQIYSPDLLAAQEELLQAVRAVDAMKQHPVPSLKSGTENMRDAAREKLRLWGLAPQQIADIEQRGAVTDHIDILAPISGVVVARNVLKGDYVEPGTPLFTLADLSQVWLILEAYEMDIGWIRYGQDVVFETQAYPGETFKGLVSFIDPVVTDKTRTVRVRVNMPNPDGRLKPEMFGHGIVRATAGAGGKVVNPALAGKWISPRHPEIVRDSPGACDICEAPLVPATSLGYAAADTPPPLVIPAATPLITGRRAVVYVEVPDRPDTFEFRPIILGARAGDYYLVEQGLKEGERVAVEGNFKIDSAMQLLAKPSMMSAEEQPVALTSFETFDVPDGFRVQIDALYAAYFNVHHALSRDQLPDAQQAARKLLAALDSVAMQGLEDNAHAAWMKEEPVLRKDAERIVAAVDIEKAREAFEPLSASLTMVARQFGSTSDQPILRYRCPMAFDDRGADWLQNKSGVENPYFGSGMFRCGEQLEVIHAGKEEGK